MKRVEIERHAIERAITSSPNITAASRALGASRRTLQNRMRDYNMPEGEPGRPRQLLPYSNTGTKGDALYIGLAVLGIVGLVWAWKRIGKDEGERKVAMRGLDLLGAS